MRVIVDQMKSKWFGGLYPWDYIPGSADYTVTSASEFNSVMSLGSAILAGKIVELQPGNYGSLTIADVTPLSLLTIRGVVTPIESIGSSGQLRKKLTGSFAIIDKLILDNCSNIRITGCEIVSSSWQATPSPAIQLSHVNTNVIIDDNCIHSGYRGSVSTPHDVLNDVPEYACVAGDMVGGVVTALEITRSYVGSLLSPGTYNLAIAEANGTGFNATFTVTNTTLNGITGNHITSTNLISGGSGYNMNIQRTRRLTFAGQQRMSDWLPYGIQNVSIGGTTANRGGLTITDNVFMDLSNAVKPAAPDDVSAITVERNSFYRVYQDYFSAGLTGSTVPPPVYFRDNFGTLPFSKSGDAGDPHSDWFQLYMNDLSPPYTPSDWVTVIQERNIFIDGNCRGGVQGNLVGDNPAGVAYQMRAVGNIIMSKNLPNAMSIDNARWSYLGYNTLARYDPTDPQNTSIANLRINDALGRNFVGGNIVEATLFQAGASTLVNTVADSNVIMGQNGATIPYSNVFVAGTLPSTKDEAIVYFASKSPYTAKGGGRSGYVDWTARSLNLTLERPYIEWTNLANQAASSSVSSEWSKLLGGPLSKSISITGGTYQIADDASGTNATAASSSSVVGNFRDKFIRVNLTNGAGSSQTTTATLTIDGLTFSFSSTTISTASYPVVAFDGSDRSVRSAGALAPADGSLLTVGFKMKFPLSNPAANTSIFGTIAGSAVFEVQLLTTGLIRINVRNAAGTAIAQINQTGSSLCDGGTHEVLVSVDMTQTVAANGRSVYIDGVDRTSATGTWSGGSGITIGYTRSTGAIQYSFGGNATTMINGEVSYFYLDTDSRLDLTSSVNRAKFAPDLIGSNGSGVSGAQPRIFLTGVASQWNDGAGLNRGYGAKYIMTGAVTDVSGSAWS